MKNNCSSRVQGIINDGSSKESEGIANRQAKDRFETIPFIKNAISYQHFYREFMEKNLPCLFDSFVTESWSVRRDWVVPEEDHIDFGFLKDKFGDREVPVSNCGQRYFNSQAKCQDMKMSSYLEYWQDIISSNYDYSHKPCLYLKDWHFFLDLQEEHKGNPFYSVPKYFQDDWLNCHWLKDEALHDPISDYRFVYMGPKGSCTPFHRDVYSSYSWSANVCGEKEWILIHPDHEKVLREKYGSRGELPFDVSFLLDDEKFIEEINPLVLTQKTGQVIFVPSDWMHQVKNTKDTISINHNWFNACNLSHIWSSLLKALREVQIELSDLTLDSIQDWSHECQKLLRVHHGMNFQDFLEILDTRVKLLQKESSLLSLLTDDEKFRHRHEISILKNFLPVLRQESSHLRIELENCLNHIHERVTSLPLNTEFEGT